MYMSICWYLRVLPVHHRPEVVDIGVKSYIEKHAICLKDYRIRPFLSIRHANGDLCKHLDECIMVHAQPAANMNKRIAS